jgi:recombination protein RecA
MKDKPVDIEKNLAVRDIGDAKSIIAAARKKKYHVFLGNDPRLVVIKVPFDIPLLDNVLGGGLPLGRTTLVVGNFGAGKTFFAQIAMALFQRLGYSVAYVDTERRYDPEWFAKSGVNVETLLVGQPDSGENALDICAFLVEQKTGLIVLDSVAALEPCAELEGQMEDATVASLARLLNKGLRKITSLNVADEDLEYRGTAFLVINQMRSGIGPYTTYALPGGKGQQFFSSIIMKVMRGSFIEDPHEKDFQNKPKKIGYTMKFETDKNNLAEWPRHCELPFHFTGSIDSVGGLVEIALDLGIIKQSGAFYWFNDETKKLQGKQALIEHLKENEKLCEELKAKIYAV